MLDTCFALLFLKRADLLPGLSEELRKRVVITDPGPFRQPGKGKAVAKAKPGQPIPPLPAEPLTAALKEVKVGVATERRLVLRCAVPFRVSGIHGTDDALQAKTDDERKTEHVLTLTLRPTEAGELTRSLHLHTDLPGQEDLAVTVQVRVAP